MEKEFGMSGALENYPWPDVDDRLEVDGIVVKVHGGQMEVLYDSETDMATAKRVANTFLDSYILRTNYKVTVNFNHFWRRTSSGATHHSLGLAADVKLTERVQVVRQRTITGTARIVTQEMHDNASFTNDSEMVRKALHDPTLMKALRYFADEVVSTDQPLAGVYKAIETITNHLGGARFGRPELARLAGKSSSYVGDLMQATQATRHANTPATVRLSEAECQLRAKVLIEAYAGSIS